MASLAVIRAQIESRIPGALQTYVPQCELLRTGIAALDAETGGIPKSALTQIYASAWNSAGRATLVASLLAQMTSRGEFCALVDANDCFDPHSAADLGADLSRLLWIRCEQAPGMKTLETAFKAADVVLQNGGFGLIAMDFSNSEERAIRRIPLTTWFRFSRVIEKMPAALLIIAPCLVAQSCASLTMHLEYQQVRWQETIGDLSHGRLLAGIDLTAEVARNRVRKQAQSVRSKFQAITRWA